MQKKRVYLVTGGAGFIGFYVIKALLRELKESTIVNVDNLNDYYDVGLKLERLKLLDQEPCNNNKYVFLKGDIADASFLSHLFETYRFDVVINLAAQAGVRYSIDHPDTYINSNIVGFFNLLEACRSHPVEHLVYASSSSVYGGNTKIPFSTQDKVDCPVSLYAATKKADELLAYAYSKLYGIPSTGLRFFTVYGPMGRPDMAYFSFANRLVKGETIDIFNFGNCKRDFTFVDDIVEGLLKVVAQPPRPSFEKNGAPVPPYAVYNLGNNNPEDLLTFVKVLTEELIAAKVLPKDFDLSKHQKLVPMQPGDVPVTYADTSDLEHVFGYKPSMPLREGLKRFARWYYSYYISSEEKR